jgi:hypothetical protein
MAVVTGNVTDEEYSTRRGQGARRGGRVNDQDFLAKYIERPAQSVRAAYDAVIRGLSTPSAATAAAAVTPAVAAALTPDTGAAEQVSVILDKNGNPIVINPSSTPSQAVNTATNLTPSPTTTPPSSGGGGTPPPTTGGGTPPADDTPNPNQRGGLLASTSDLLGGALKEGNPATRNLGRLGYLAPAVAAFQDYTEGGNPYAVGGGAAAGLGVTALTRSAGRSVGGGKGAVLQMIAPLLGLGTQQLTTAAIQKDRQRKTGEGDPNAFSTQLGRLEQLRKIGNEGQIQMMNAERAGIMDISNHFYNKELEFMQSMNPLIEQQRNNDVVRQQQIMNSMGQNFAMLGSMATTGKLALGAQREAAANLRTFMTAAPYANSVLQAPTITF